VPPPYLFSTQPVPVVPSSVPKQERTQALIEAYAERGDALKAANARAEALEQWVRYIRRVYPDSVEYELDDLMDEAGDPEGADER